MAKAVKLLVLAALLAAGSAGAQALADPTRPPPLLLARTPAGAQAASPSSGPVLQSVLVGRQAGGRQVAVIDGETVRLGATFRGAVLVRITETEVELQRGRERQVLKLFAAGARPGAGVQATLARGQ
jgi:MSHA biogenesis protein MshK